LAEYLEFIQPLWFSITMPLNLAQKYRPRVFQSKSQNPGIPWRIPQASQNRTQECRVKKIPWIGPGQRLRSKKCAHSGQINGPGGKLEADSQDVIRFKRFKCACFEVL